MRYFGGKARIGKRLAAVLNNCEGKRYWEPFCGMFSVGKHVTGERVASDAQLDLIMLLEAVRDGWRPPATLTECEYDILRTARPTPLRAFAGFGCSNSGKFFGGYARENTGRNFALNAKRSLARLKPLIQGVNFYCHHYVDGDSFIATHPTQTQQASQSVHSIRLRSGDGW